MFIRLALVLMVCLSLRGYTTDMAGHEPIPLPQLLGQALVHNPVIQAALARAEASDSRAKAERANLLPEVTASASWGTRHADTLAGDQAQSIRSKQVSLNQPLGLGEEYARWQARKAEASAELARAQNEIQKTLLQLSDAYLTILQERERHDALTDLEDVLRRQLHATKRLYAEGEGTKAHIAAVQARLSVAQASRQRAHQAFTESVAHLQSLIALPLEPAYLVWPSPTVPKFRNPKTILTAHPLTGEAKARLEAQAYQLKATATDLFPDVALQVSAGEERGLPASSNTWENRLTVNVSVPLFRGGRTVYGIQAAQREREAAQMSLDAATYEVRRELTGAREAMTTTQTSLKAAEDGLAAQHTALRGARLEYDLGERSLIQLLDAEQEFVDARMSLANARKDRVLASYRLRAAQGELTLP